MIHHGTQPIGTERLILRPFAATDLEDMLQNWVADPQVQHEYGEPAYETAEEAQTLLNHYLDAYAEPDYYRWAIIERKSMKNIGQIAFCRVWDDCETAEVEYCIGAAFWGNGYAGEALAALIDFTFSHTEFRKLEAYHRAENIKSARVLQKSPMHLTDTVERFRRANETPEGEICYCVEA
ncbi:MAG TPA: N-acetyltransferase [Ruminococcus sp.]|nr:N-acetyltransferase [Ruminococcus sp.]